MFILFTIEDVKRALRCADNKATKLLQELEKFGLIERKRRGQGKPSLVYVKTFRQNLQKRVSRIVIMTILVASKSRVKTLQNHDVISLHEQIRQLKAMGKTIILASHDMTEVENLCDRIAILSGGKIAFIGTVEQLGKTIGKHYNITIQTENGMEKYESENIGDSLLALLMEYKEKGETIVDIQIDRGSLEQHFIKIAKGA